jgi:hypothetical protein
MGSIGRIIIVPVVFALTMAGSVVGGAAVSASAAQVHSVAAAAGLRVHYHTGPGVHYHT